MPRQNTQPRRAADKPVLDPRTQAFLDTLAAQGAPPIHELTVEDARAVLTNAQAITIAKLPADIEDRVIPVGPTGQVRLHIVRPKGGPNRLPVILYFHGGGWVLGDRNTHDRLIRELAHGATAAVIFVEFTPAPEAKYPTQLEEAYAATKWVAENGAALNVDPARLVVSGDSAGGTLAAAIPLLAKERHGPHISFQLLFYPVTDGTHFDTPSYNTYAEGYFLTRKAMEWFWRHYLPDMSRAKEPTASPLLASLEQLQGLPPALIIVGEHDVLRDEGEAYAHKLMQAGVPVTATRYLGTIHDFVMLNAITLTAAPRAALQQATEALKEVFATEESARAAA